jgi:hypothetical protein
MAQPGVVETDDCPVGEHREDGTVVTNREKIIGFDFMLVISSIFASLSLEYESILKWKTGRIFALSQQF